MLPIHLSTFSRYVCIWVCRNTYNTIGDNVREFKKNSAGIRLASNITIAMLSSKPFYESYCNLYFFLATFNIIPTTITTSYGIYFIIKIIYIVIRDMHFKPLILFFIDNVDYIELYMFIAFIFILHFMLFFYAKTIQCESRFFCWLVTCDRCILYYTLENFYIFYCMIWTKIIPK